MNPISIVVPDGSMQEVVMNLLAKAGLPVTIKNKRTKVGKVDNVDWISRIALQRPQEIPQYLKLGHFDVAIVGEDWIADWGYKFPMLARQLPIGRGGNKSVRIVLAVSQSSGIERVEQLPQKCQVATEYTRLVKKFFADRGRNDIVVMPSYGNTEHKIQFGAIAIVDVTESGESLKENQLRVIHEIMESFTVIVANTASLADKEKRPYIDCFAKLVIGAYQASQYVMLIANVPKHVLDKACGIIGGLKGPSCSKIFGNEDWFAIQSIVPRSNEHRIIFDLLQIGVTDIIVNRDIPLIMT